MTTAIRLIQGVTTPQQVNRIVDWNIERNELALDSNLEINMLAEEAKEYFDAKTFVDKVDAVGDIIFVGVGTLAKTTNAYHLSAKELFAPIDFILTDFVGRVETEGIGSDFFLPMLSEVLDAIIDANEEKGTEKDEKGKVKKPEGFVPPEGRIAVIIEKYIATSAAQNKTQTEDIFPQGAN